MEFEVAHSFPESRLLASYPLLQGTNAIGNARFCNLFAPPLSQVAHLLVAASFTPRPLLTETRAKIKAIRRCESNLPR